VEKVGPAVGFPEGWMIQAGRPCTTCGQHHTSSSSSLILSHCRRGRGAFDESRFGMTFTLEEDNNKLGGEGRRFSCRPFVTLDDVSNDASITQSPPPNEGALSTAQYLQQFRRPRTRTFEKQRGEHTVPSRTQRRKDTVSTLLPTRTTLKGARTAKRPPRGGAR